MIEHFVYAGLEPRFCTLDSQVPRKTKFLLLVVPLLSVGEEESATHLPEDSDSRKVLDRLDEGLRCVAL
jgi:hypothetical protein